MVRLRRLFHVDLEVFHLDHRLRAGSREDAVYVKRLAERHDLEFHLRVAESAPAKGESVEAWAREQRLSWVGDVVRETGASRIAQGHTLDDQAETLLIALVRGGGLEAMAGIAPVLGNEVQPLIDVTRSEIEAAVRSLGLRPRIDPTNKDTSLLRNALRLKGLPALERATGRELSRSLARTADLLRRDERELSRQAAAAFEDVASEDPQGWELDAASLLTLPVALSTRVIRAAIYRLGVLPTEDSITAVLDLAGGRPGRRRDLHDGAKAVRDKTSVRLMASGASNSARL
jgi:tRNA(Ile)-lysidine synthase